MEAQPRHVQRYITSDGRVCELRIDYGPGYRIYFGQVGSTIVLLLCGGDKFSKDKSYSGL